MPTLMALPLMTNSGNQCGAGRPRFRAPPVLPAHSTVAAAMQTVYNGAMRNLNIDWTHWFPGLACFFLLSVGMARGAEPTAFELIKEGNRFLGEQSKDKVLEIRSEKSIGGLVAERLVRGVFRPGRQVQTGRGEIRRRPADGRSNAPGARSEAAGRWTKSWTSRSSSLTPTAPSRSPPPNPCWPNSPSKPRNSGWKTARHRPSGRCVFGPPNSASRVTVDLGRHLHLRRERRGR